MYVASGPHFLGKCRSVLFNTVLSLPECLPPELNGHESESWIRARDVDLCSGPTPENSINVD